ncbi:glucose-6-phosphate dehydrogenase [Candidatus Azambacteria bacterium]|nr:glucose-6-phosphate dehydrogenase [Candidatus Azambacteria bacterium]
MENIKVNTPTVVVVFGARGDLGRRKLFPAFFDLYSKGILPDKFKLLGVSRAGISKGEFEEVVKNSISEFYKGEARSEKLAGFAGLSDYLCGTFEDFEMYKKISEELLNMDREFGVCSNKLFYLAVPPKNYETILKNLDRSGLTIPCSGAEGWTRVLIEKPFGSDLKTAKSLDRLLGELFHEEQIFRIDHYLAKETIQNILTFRFTNTLFEPIWNNKYIEKVEISLFEKLDVSERGGFYDGIGALRDVGQNHILQILASIAMENPKELNAKNIRAKRAKVLSELKSISKKEMQNSVVKGQYEGYLDEKGVAEDSKTETYFKLKAFLKNKRWKGVPFILESGKALAESKIEAKVFFKEKKPCFCAAPHEKHVHQNILTFKIQPDESIMLQFYVKKPSLTMDYTEQDLTFKYGGDALGNVMPDAYEKILFDCIVGDQTLFTSTKEVMFSWKFITAILEVWQNEEPKIYQKGSEGPDAS